MKRALFVLLCVFAATASTGCTTIVFPGHDRVDDTFAEFCASTVPLGWLAEERPVNGRHHWGRGAVSEDGDGHCLGGHCNCVCPDDGMGDGNGRGRGFGNRGAMVRGPNGEAIAAPGMSAGAVAYPYYTTRGPRDFFLNNPPSIGP